MSGCYGLLLRTVMFVVALASTLLGLRITYAEVYSESDPPRLWFGATGGLLVERHDPGWAYGLDWGGQLFHQGRIVAVDADVLAPALVYRGLGSALVYRGRVAVVFHTDFFGAELRTRYSYCCDRPYVPRYVRGVRGFKFGVELGKAPLDTFATLEFGVSCRSQHVYEVAFAYDPFRGLPGISFDVSFHYGSIYFGIDGRGLLGDNHPLSVTVLGSVGYSLPMRWEHR